MYFKKSYHAKRHLKVYNMLQYMLKEGIVSVGKTRFITLYYAGSSVLLALPAIKDLIKGRVIKLSSVRVQ